VPAIEDLFNAGVLRQILPFPRIFESVACGGIRKFNLKRKAISEGNLGVENADGLRRAQAEPKQNTLRPFLDFRVNSTVDGGSFHHIKCVAFATRRQFLFSDQD